MTKFIKVNPTSEARRRFFEAKEKLPRRWRALFFIKHPEYDTPEGQRYLSDVSSGNTTDLRVTEFVEALAKDYEQPEIEKKAS